MSAAAEAVRAYARGAAVRVWISYARLSRASDRKADGQGASLQIGQQHAANHGHILAEDPAAVIVDLTDDGYSAYLDVTRPDFERGLAMIAAGEVRGFVGWHADRITRQVEVTAKLWRLCENAGTEVHTTIGGKHDDPDSLYFETMIGERAGRQMRNRMLASHKGKAERGEPMGGSRPFGYERIRLENGAPSLAIIESEAVAIQDMAARALRGEGLATIARDYTERGLPTVRGGKWRPGVIRQMLIGPVLAGRRTHATGDTTTEVEGNWPAIIDPATREALRRTLTDAERRTCADNSPRYLLSGIAVCGLCGAGVNAAQVPAGEGTRGIYRCLSCFKVTRAMAPVDEYVEEYVLARLEEMDASGTLVSSEDTREAETLAVEIAALEGRDREAAAGFAAGVIDLQGLADARAELAKRRAALDVAVGRLADKAAEPMRLLDGATGPLARPAWARWAADTSGEGLARRRAITAFLVTVHIDPTGKGRRKFDPASVRVEYRDFG